MLPRQELDQTLVEGVIERFNIEKLHRVTLQTLLEKASALLELNLKSLSIDTKTFTLNANIYIGNRMVARLPKNKIVSDQTHVSKAEELSYTLQLHGSATAVSVAKTLFADIFESMLRLELSSKDERTLKLYRPVFEEIAHSYAAIVVNQVNFGEQPQNYLELNANFLKKLYRKLADLFEHDYTNALNFISVLRACHHESLRRFYCKEVDAYFLKYSIGLLSQIIPQLADYSSELAKTLEPILQASKLHMPILYEAAKSIFKVREAYDPNMPNSFSKNWDDYPTPNSCKLVIKEMEYKLHDMFCQFPKCSIKDGLGLLLENLRENEQWVQNRIKAISQPVLQSPEVASCTKLLNAIRAGIRDLVTIQNQHFPEDKLINKHSRPVMSP